MTCIGWQHVDPKHGHIYLSSSVPPNECRSFSQQIMTERLVYVGSALGPHLLAASNTGHTDKTALQDCVYTGVGIHMHVYVCVHLRAYTHVYKQVHVSICTHVCIYTCVHVYVHFHKCVHVHKCSIHVHTWMDGVYA